MADKPTVDPGLRRILDGDDPLPHLRESDMRTQLLSFARDLNRIYQEERARAEQLEEAVAELQESYLATIQAMAFIVEARDLYTRTHLSRSHDYAVALADRVSPGLADDRVFRYGFLLHDIGKVGIPEHILRKAGPLTKEEWEVMQTHPLIGAQILHPIKFLHPAISIVECHHEQWDGNGYPRGLRRDEIPIAARIFSVVDTFDAITSDRPYRRALSIDEALDEILKSAGTQLDPEIAASFVELCRERAAAWPLPHDHSVEGVQ